MSVKDAGEWWERRVQEPVNGETEGLLMEVQCFSFLFTGVDPTIPLCS